MAYPAMVIPIKGFLLIVSVFVSYEAYLHVQTTMVSVFYQCHSKITCVCSCILKH